MSIVVGSFVFIHCVRFIINSLLLRIQTVHIGHVRIAQRFSKCRQIRSDWLYTSIVVFDCVYFRVLSILLHNSLRFSFLWRTTFVRQTNAHLSFVFLSTFSPLSLDGFSVLCPVVFTMHLVYTNNGL